MKRDEVLQKHKQYLFPCVVNYYAQPLVVDHARAQYIFDTDGRRYLDFFGGILTISVGQTGK